MVLIDTQVCTYTQCMCCTVVCAHQLVNLKLALPVEADFLEGGKQQCRMCCYRSS